MSWVGGEYQQEEQQLNLLQQKARDWAADVVKLHNTPVPRSLQAEKNKLLARAKTIKETIESVIGVVPQLDPLNQLGVLPVVFGVAGVAGAFGAIAAWYRSSNALQEKISLSRERNAQRQTLINQGMSPQEAYGLIPDEAQSNSIFAALKETKNIVGLGLVGFGLYMAHKKGLI